MPFTPSERALKKIEITYYEIKEPAVKKESASKKSDPVLNKLPDIKKEEILNPPKPIAKKPTEAKQPVKPVAEIIEAKEKTFEKVVEEEKDDAKKATYISYYKAVREKIRQHADRNYPIRKRVGRGEIFISFVVASSGELLRVKIIDEKSVDDRTLRGIAMNSIREASPFPPFPKGMRQYQITFNIVISFELNN
ncbi:MAG: TonB family protein [Candidatus Omnitrophica bacterium]|nr:TonB family protein [Candidatus Omnitrophota bacterium]